MAIRAVTIKINQIGNAAKGIKSISGGIANLGMQATKVAIGGMAILGTATVVAGGKLISLGSDAEEMLGKFNVVFGEFAKSVTGELSNFGKEVGRSRYDLQEMAASLQDTFVPLGFARGEAAKMSVEMTKLAVDVASFNNVSDPEVMRDFQSALVGNHETVRKYGIIITQATLDQELMNMGVEGGIKAATEQEKVQARLNLIYAGTTDAQGDAAKTSKSWANQMRALGATIKDTATDMGMRLLPIVTPLLIKFNEFASRIAPMVIDKFEVFADILANRVVPAISQFVNGWLIPMAQRLWMLIQTILPGISSGFNTIGSIIMGTIIPAIQSFVSNALPAVLLFVRNSVVPLISRMLELGKNVLPTVVSALGKVINFILTKAGPTILNFVENTVIPLGAKLVEIAQTILPIIRTALSNLAAFFTETLIPTVKTFVVETLVPMAQSFLQFAVDAIPRVRLALNSIWSVISDKVIPVVEGLIKIISAVISSISAWVIELTTRAKPIVDSFSKRLNEDLGPALAIIGDSINRIIVAFGGNAAIMEVNEKGFDAIGAILVGLKATFDVIIFVIQAAAVAFDTLAKAVEWVKSAVESVKDKLDDLQERLANIQLPYWLTPGSPTPFEVGLRGIADAMGDLEDIRFMPKLTTGGAAAVGGGITPVTVNLVYSPAVSLADQYEAEQVLVPYVENSLRRLKASGQI